MIRTILIIEILGRPADFIQQTLEEVIKTLGEEKNVSVERKKFFDIREIGELFSTFAEVEISVENFYRLLEICFDYMPSSVEIIDPAELRFSLQDANAILNYLASKLHKYDAIIKTLRAEKTILLKQLEEAGIRPALPLPPSQEERSEEKKERRKKLSK